MEQSENRDNGFFDVITDKQTYMSMIYLMLSFPLGIFYFAYGVTLFTLGISLIPVFIGVPLLYAFMISVKYLMKFERKMASVLLGVYIPENNEATEKGAGILKKFRNEFFNTEIWKALIYIIVKFLMGILIFCLFISLTFLSLGLIAAPIVYQIVEYSPDMIGGLHLSIDGVRINGLLELIGVSATPSQEMLIFMISGVFIGIGSMHLFNRTANLLVGFLKLMSPVK